MWTPGARLGWRDTADAPEGEGGVSERRGGGGKGLRGKGGGGGGR